MSLTKKKLTKKNNETLNETLNENLNEKLNIYKLKSIYKELLINKIPFTRILLEFILNYYLLLKEYRSLFLIICNNKMLKVLQEHFLSKYDIKYIIKSNFFLTRLIIYNPKKFNIKNLDISFRGEFAKQLGDFYVCAKSKGLIDGSFDINNKYRINISIAKSYNNTNKLIFNNIELYGQMCIPSLINDINITKLKNISRDISTILKKFDKDLITELKIVKFKSIIGFQYNHKIDKKIIYN